MLTVEPQLVEAFVNTGQVRLVFWPNLGLGEGSLAAAEAAYCAGDQDPVRFWAMHYRLFQQQRELWTAQDRNALLKSYARELRLDEPAFAACLDGGKFRPEITAQDQVRRNEGIRQRPSFKIFGPAQPQGRLAAGSQSFQAFQTLIQQARGE